MLESVIGIDENLFILINTHLSNGFFDTVLVPIRHKLFWIPLYIAILTLIFYKFRQKSWVALLGIAMTILLSDTISSKVIKNNVQRTRPCHIKKLQPVQRVHCSSGYSFTSSHATNHFALGTYFFLIFSFLKGRYLFFLWAGMIGFAQIYVGVHYPLDVLCGSILGLFLGWISFAIYSQLDQYISTRQTKMT